MGRRWTDKDDIWPYRALVGDLNCYAAHNEMSRYGTLRTWAGELGACRTP